MVASPTPGAILPQFVELRTYLWERIRTMVMNDPESDFFHRDDERSRTAVAAPQDFQRAVGIGGSRHLIAEIGEHLDAEGRAKIARRRQQFYQFFEWQLLMLICRKRRLSYLRQQCGNGTV